MSYSTFSPNVIKILKSKQLILHGPSFNGFSTSAIVIVPRFMSIHYIALDTWHFKMFSGGAESLHVQDKEYFLLSWYTILKRGRKLEGF